MLNNWHTILPEYMKTWNLDRNEVRKFDRVILTFIVVHLYLSVRFGQGFDA
jgi:hypothetical protein